MKVETKADDTVRGVSKRERYNWTTIDKPGEFAMIEKHSLKVDQSYQRKHSDTKINKMASEWSWVACGAISIALRHDGEWYVMDGQHRVLAALKRDDIIKLPCMVFDVEELADEARGFLATNINRKAMTMVDRFKAMLMTEDHYARVVNELVISTGRHVGLGGTPNAFSAVQITLQCAREDEAALRRIWPMIAELCTDKRVIQHLIAGMWYLERHMRPGESLSSTRWRNRIIQVGYEAVLASIDQSAAFYGGGKGLKNCALGIVQAINKGLRNTLVHTIRTDEGR